MPLLLKEEWSSRKKKCRKNLNYYTKCKSNQCKSEKNRFISSITIT